MVLRPFTQWWQTQRFKLYQQEDNGTSVYKGVFLIYFGALCLVSLGICLFSDSVIMVMAESGFHNAAKAVPILTIATLFQNITLYTNFSFQVKEKTIYIMYLQYVNAIFITVLFLILIPKYGYIGASYSILIASVIGFYMTYILANRLFDAGINLHWMHGIILIMVVLVVLDEKYLSVFNGWHKIFPESLIMIFSCAALYYGLQKIAYSRDLITPVLLRLKSR